MNKNRKIEEIKLWREVLVQLPDQKFFNLMRLYLGEIKTPFNKQKLIEQLAAFLRRSHVKENIISSLDTTDVYILTAIHFLPIATGKILNTFFESDFSYSKLFERINNLEERLILFEINSQNEEPYYKINPHLSDEIAEILDIKIFCLPEKISKKKNACVLIDNIKLVGAYSFFIHTKDTIKLNSAMKKKALEKFYSIFPDFAEKKSAIHYLLKAFLNLGLFTRNENSVSANLENWKAFGELSPQEAKMYLTVASTGNYRKKFLTAQVSLFYNFFTSLNPNAQYKKTDLEKAFLLQLTILKYNFTALDTALLDDESAFNPELNSKKSIIDIAILFGLFYEKDGLITVNSSFKNDDTAINQPILISPSFEVTILPYSNINCLLELLLVMEPLSIQTTGSFEINRKTAGLCFENNITAEQICDLLKEKSDNLLPQNIEASIMQWYESCSAVQLYSGVVAVVSKEKQSIFEKSAPLGAIVLSKLADGVFLLKGDACEDMLDEIKSAGLEYLIRQPKIMSTLATNSFERIAKQKDNTTSETRITKAEWKKQQLEKQKVYGSQLQHLQTKLKSLDLQAEEKKAILSGIHRRVIIDEEQIKKGKTNAPVVEASGLDFLGKIRICEKAIKENYMLEIQISKDDELKTILCTPVNVIRGDSNAILTASIHPDYTVMEISIAHISNIKIIKTSVFS